MAYTRRDIRGGAVQTTLSGDITSGGTSIAITASTGWPDGSVNGPFYVVIDPGLSTEEKVLCATRTGTSLAVTTRGADGSTASAHSSGAVIYPVHVSVDSDEANYAVSQTVGKIAAASDLLVGSGTNALARLAKGSNSTVLGVDSGGTLGYTTVTSAMITNGTIVDADVSASAALAYSKLALTGSILNADINAAAAIAYSKLALASSITSSDIVDGTIVNGDINAAAAIAVSKTALTAGTGLSLSTNTLSVDNAVFNTGASTSFTPTLTQSGAVAKTVTFANYMRLGRMIFAQYILSITGAGTAGVGVRIGLPVTPASTQVRPIGVGYYQDISVANYHAIAFLQDSTTFWLQRSDAATTGPIGNDPTFATANGDVTGASIWYEAAS